MQPVIHSGQVSGRNDLVRVIGQPLLDSEHRVNNWELHHRVQIGILRKQQNLQSHERYGLEIA
jgi:hypothetical protein